MRPRSVIGLILPASLAALAGAPACESGVTSGASTPQSNIVGPVVTYGQKYEGGEFHLGPVDWDETKFHNACAPQSKYASAIRSAQGELLAGLWSGVRDVAQYCDACIVVTTARGKSALLRVVTFGDTTKNSIDVSPKAWEILEGTSESLRTMTWQLAKCPDVGKIAYEFQTGSSEYWTSLWIRKARVPIKKVEVKSANHSSYVALTRGSDGTLTDEAGFGKGAFTMRVTALDDQELIDTFDWPSSGIAGQTLDSKGNLQ